MSSTVIPLSVYEVSYGSSDGKISEEEYKRIYMKHMHKKAHQYHQPGILDKLVTGRKGMRVGGFFFFNLCLFCFLCSQTSIEKGLINC